MSALQGLAMLLLAQSATARRNRFHGAVNPSLGLCRQMARQLVKLRCAAIR
jgi:hypothetical protein